MGLVYFNKMLTERELLLGEKGKPTLRLTTYAWCPDTRKQRCYQNAGHYLKEKEWLVPLVKRMPFFFYTCVIPFSCSGPLGVSENLIVFFFFFFNLIFFFFKFIYLFPTDEFMSFPRKLARSEAQPVSFRI